MSQYLGDISAYALAVSQGYTGTEEEYAELMASYATVGQTAVTAAQTAATKASEAATSATTATNKATEATTAATTATTKAGEASTSASTATSAKDTAVSASQTATAKATEATTAAATATSAKTDAVAANTAAQSAKTAAQTAQTGAETAAASVQSSAEQIATNAADISQLKSEISGYETTNDNRFVFGDNLLDTSVAVDNYYVSNTNGNLITYSGWFATGHMAVDDSTEYAFVVKESGIWKKPNGCYYAFYDANKAFTHGGVSALNSNLVPQSGDAFCVVSYYTTSKYVCMFGKSSAMDEYMGTNKQISKYFVAPKYVNDPYKGLIDVFTEISNPYYSLRVLGNRISVTADGAKNGAFVRFDTITTLGEDGFKSKSWNEFKADIANDPYVSIEKAYDGTEDTLIVYPEYGIVYNYKTNTYHIRNIVYIKDMTQHETMFLYVDTDSVPHGAFYTAWANNHTSGIRKYIRTIEAKETELLNFGDNFVFAFATDCHWYFDDTAYHNYTNEMIEELRHCIGFDCYINGGDSIYYGTKFKLNGVASMTEAFEVNHDNYVYCIGNHDYNGVSGATQNSSWMFDANGIASLCLRKMKNIHRPDGARYYYRDFEDKKIRVIVLDTSDLDITFNSSGDLTTPDPLVTFVVRKAQVDWLCDALDCPASDWGVIVVMHVGLYLAEDGFIDNNPLSNGSAVIEVLKKYVSKSAYSYSTSGSFPISGSGTFENSKGHLVGVWSGHAHTDGYCNKDGFNAIQTECGYPDGNRTVGTVEEICVDCVCVDMSNKTITLKRFGYGSDRDYTFI